MACKIELRTNQDGKFINWEPSQIPPSKPFIKIVTSAYEPITTFNDMRFIKTHSLLYIHLFTKKHDTLILRLGTPKRQNGLSLLAINRQTLPIFLLLASLKPFIPQSKRLDSHICSA